MRTIGLEILPDEAFASSTVTAISLSDPAQDGVRSIMEKDFGIMISGGLTLLKGKIIRVGHMGLTATDACIERTATALEKSLELVKGKKEVTV